MKVKGITHITFKEDPEKAIVYRIIPSVDIVKKSKSGVCTPATITFAVYKIEGGKQTQITFGNSDVKMRVRKSTGSWENSINWTTKSYTLDSSTEWIEAQLFVNNSTWLDADLLDSKRVPVIEDGNDGDAAVQYWLETTDPVIHYDSNKVTNTTSFTVTCKKKTGSGAATACSDFYLDLEQYNGQTWVNSLAQNKQSSRSITTNKNYTRYRIKASNSDGSVIACEINIEAVFDGDIGPAGAKGAIYLCRGEWNNQETYIKTDDVVHYVIYEGYAYEPKKASVTGGNNPLADVQGSGTNWKSLGRYDVIATRVLLANFALIAGAVFWNNKLMSQYGTNNSGATVNNYTDYSEDANGNETGTFHPNILIDFLKGYLKAVKGKIGNFEIEGNNLVANVGSNKLTLNATNGKITLTSSQSGGSYVAPGESSYSSTITLDVATGVVEARNSKGVSYISASGIFCNNAATQTVSATMGTDNKAAVCGLGYGTVNKSDWQNENFIAGVYGRAYNSGTAPTYGGFFQNLMAAGLFLKTKSVEETTSSIYLSESDSLVIGYSRNQQIVYLPNDGVIGRTIFFKQWWTGSMRVYPRGGQVIYDDSTENSYIDVSEGYVLICMFTIGYINGVKKEAWLTSKFKGNINT